MQTFGSQRKHPSRLRAFRDLVAAQKQTLKPPETPNMQAKISDISQSVGAKRHVPQAKVDRLLINFV